MQEPHELQRSTTHGSASPQAGFHFDVSTGLKRVLGAELITSDEVAIFELVKNSFDAQATLVQVFFGNDEIVILDNGIGMTADDIKSKWLFVAYSFKREEENENYREKIVQKRFYAGSKGIGRFSSDRLGSALHLQTIAKADQNPCVHSLRVDWDAFEKNPKEHFDRVRLSYVSKPNLTMQLPEKLTQPSHGTAIVISKLRRQWSRPELLKLRASLAKLINPFGGEADPFRIELIAPDEHKEDEKNKRRAKHGDDLEHVEVVNGPIGNFIFSTLRDKTTSLTVRLTDEGTHLITQLVDRGESIYRIREPNPYQFLRSSKFMCELFFLNRKAKATFTRRMGVESVKFGSVFVFRNGFRVFPIGEADDDWFGINRRKQQGYKRFFGTRDIIGRLDVSGSNSDFREASSRDAGLVESTATIQLRTCFIEHCLKRLETYVVPATFADKADTDFDNLVRLKMDPGKARITTVVAKLAGKKNIELLEYSRDLIRLVDENSSQFEDSVEGLRKIAAKTRDKDLLAKIDQAEERFKELKSAENNARKEAEETRLALEAAELRATKAEAQEAESNQQLREEKKRAIFLESTTNLDLITVQELQHQIRIYAIEMQHQIENFLGATANMQTVPRDSVVDFLDKLLLVNKKVNAIAKFVTKANFRLESEEIDANLIDYISEYVQNVSMLYETGMTKIDVTSDGSKFFRRFKPIDIAIVVDNLISNSRKAKARHISFNLRSAMTDTLFMEVIDDGKGFDKSFGELEDMFLRGATKTDGAGLGLAHVRRILGEMQGSISAVRHDQRGAKFEILIQK